MPGELGQRARRAATRRALTRLPGITLEHGSMPNYCMMVQLDQNTDAFDPEWLYLMNSHRITVAGAVNGDDEHDPRWFCMVGFNHEHRFGSGCCGARMDAVEEARRYFERHTDLLPCISDRELRPTPRYGSAPVGPTPTFARAPSYCSGSSSAAAWCRKPSTCPTPRSTLGRRGA